MAASIFLARLLGPLLLLPGIGVLINPRAFRTIAAEVLGSVTLVYLFGFLDFAAGLAIVLFHNRWAAGWPVLITLIGWALLIRGAVHIVAPDSVSRYGASLIKSYPLWVTGVIVVILGLALCYFGYLA